MSKAQASPLIECVSPWLDEGVPEVGQRVVYCSDYGLAGVVKFAGSTEFSDGHDWVGIMLDKPRGKNDGRVKDKQYFTCPPNHGLFMRAKVLLPDQAVAEVAEQPPEVQPVKSRRGRARVDRSDTVESRDDATPKSSSSRSRRMVQSAASQERLSIHVSEKQILRTAKPSPEDVRKELRTAAEERDMEALQRLLPNAALLGVAEAEVASARHVFDFQVQLDLFRELESLGRRIEDMSAAMAAGPPGTSTERQADFSETLPRQLEALLASAVREVTSKVSEDFASLREELRGLRREHADPPAESPDMVSKQAKAEEAPRLEEIPAFSTQQPGPAALPETRPRFEDEAVLPSPEPRETAEPREVVETRLKRRGPKASAEAEATESEKPPDSEEKVPVLDLEEDSERSRGKWNRAVSVHHIDTTLQEEMFVAGLSRDAKVYEIEPDVIRKKGIDVVCPRDGRPGAAYVDCLQGADEAASASFMLSYTWGYKMGDIMDTLTQYCRDANLDPKRTYTWMCCFCINQHRVKETEAAGETVPFEEFKKAFGDRVKGIGKIVAMMAPWKDPFYIKRVWCDFEMYTATSEKQEVVIAMPPKEAADFRGALLSGGVSEVWAALGAVKVEQAEASVPEDRERILTLIENGPGFHVLNCAVAERLQGWIVQASEGYLEQRLKESANASDLDLAKLGEGVGDLLRQVGKYDSSMKYLQESKRIREDQGELETPEGANLLRSIGVVCAEQQDIDRALETCNEARCIREKTCSLDTPDGARLLSNIGSLMVRKHVNSKGNDPSQLDEALQCYEKARKIREETDTIRTDEGAQLLYREGNAFLVRDGDNDLDAAIDRYEEAKKIREERKTLDTPEAARLLSSLASALLKRKQVDKAIDNFNQARRALELTGTLNTSDGAKVLQQLGQALLDSGEPEKAKEVLEQGIDLHPKGTQAGQNLLAMMKNAKASARKAKGDVTRKAQSRTFPAEEAQTQSDAVEEAPAAE